MEYTHRRPFQMTKPGAKNKGNKMKAVKITITQVEVTDGVVRQIVLQLVTSLHSWTIPKCWGKLHTKVLGEVTHQSVGGSYTPKLQQVKLSAQEDAIFIQKLVS